MQWLPQSNLCYGSLNQPLFYALNTIWKGKLQATTEVLESQWVNRYSHIHCYCYGKYCGDSYVICAVINLYIALHMFYCLCNFRGNNNASISKTHRAPQFLAVSWIMPGYLKIDLCNLINIHVIRHYIMCTVKHKDLVSFIFCMICILALLGKSA